MKAAKHVFVAKIVRELPRVTNAKQCQGRPDLCLYAYSYKVAVEGSWKGDITKDLELDMSQDDCSMGKLTSPRYVFFAEGTAAAPRISGCNGSRPATAAVLAEMTRMFGAPARP